MEGWCRQMEHDQRENDLPEDSAFVSVDMLHFSNNESLISVLLLGHVRCIKGSAASGLICVSFCSAGPTEQDVLLLNIVLNIVSIELCICRKNNIPNYMLYTILCII